MYLFILSSPVSDCRGMNHVRMWNFIDIFCFKRFAHNLNPHFLWNVIVVFSLVVIQHLFSLQNKCILFLLINFQRSNSFWIFHIFKISRLALLGIFRWMLFYFNILDFFIFLRILRIFPKFWSNWTLICWIGLFLLLLLFYISGQGLKLLIYFCRFFLLLF